MVIQGIITLLIFINICFYLNRVLVTNRYKK